MIVEILFGYLTASMALLADGWHMASHAGAMLVAWIAYRFVRKLDENSPIQGERVLALGGYTNAILLLPIAGFMVFECFERFIYPKSINFSEAIAVASVGLLVNVVSAFLLGKGHHHDLSHSDHNLRSAYFHVLADALTSILALVALISARQFDIHWIDPAVGVLGSIVILRWSYTLARESGLGLLTR